MELSAAIAAIAALVTALLKIWSDKTPQRDQEQRYENIQQGRNDIAAADTAAVNNRVDRLLVLETDNPGHADQHLGSDQDTQGRIAKLTSGTGVAPQ